MTEKMMIFISRWIIMMKKNEASLIGLLRDKKHYFLIVP